jgi:hypothetical protein
MKHARKASILYQWAANQMQGGAEQPVSLRETGRAGRFGMMGLGAITAAALFEQKKDNVCCKLKNTSGSDYGASPIKMPLPLLSQGLGRQGSGPLRF